jgi:hypothetical protein
MRQMAPLKFETANRAGDTAALEESVRNFNELGMNDTAEARIAKELLGRIKRLEAGRKHQREFLFCILVHVNSYPGTSVLADSAE